MARCAWVAPPSDAIDAGEAMHVPTGGVLPTGADAVVPIEELDPVAFAGEVGEAFALRSAVGPGDYVTQAGDDMCAGDLILASGRTIGGPELGVLATLGIIDGPGICAAAHRHRFHG